MVVREWQLILCTLLRLCLRNLRSTLLNLSILPCFVAVISVLSTRFSYFILDTVYAHIVPCKLWSDQRATDKGRNITVLSIYVAFDVYPEYMLGCLHSFDVRRWTWEAPLKATLLSFADPWRYALHYVVLHVCINVWILNASNKLAFLHYILFRFWESSACHP